jgi:uncharacterized phage protein (TIGR02220 family)/predicted phage replisome organizer
MADIKWIKICTDTFEDEKIRLIENIPKGDTIILMWFKLLCFAGKQNNEGVFVLDGKIPYTDAMLATIFNRPLSTVKLALQTLERFGMIERINETVTIPNWGKHQNLDQLEHKKQYMKDYMRSYREKQKTLTDGVEVNPCKTNSKTNVSGTDKEEEKDKDIYINIYIAVVKHLNEKAGTKYKPNTAKTKSHIKARLDEGFTLDDFKTVIDKKCAEWVGTEFEQYLRPETLFGTKFESYLNAKVVPKKDDTKATIDEAKTDLDDLF